MVSWSIVHSTMVYSETLWWSMVDGLNHGFWALLLRRMHPSRYVADASLVACVRYR